MPEGCDLRKPFAPPTFVPGFATSAVQGPSLLRFSRDLLTAYFTAVGPESAGYGDLFVGTRTNPSDGFAAFSRLTALDTAAFDWWPTVTGDGLTLVFERSVPDDGPQHLHYATRSDPAGAFAYVGPLDVNSTGRDMEPFVREDGQVLYFASDRAVPNDWDIYRAPLVGPPVDFGAPVAVAELNSPGLDGAPVATPSEQIIYFASNRPQANGPRHIWTAMRADLSQHFSTPVPVDELNALGNEQLPTFVTADGCTLYFSVDPDAGEASTIYVAQKPPR